MFEHLWSIWAEANAKTTPTVPGGSSNPLIDEGVRKQLLALLKEPIVGYAKAKGIPHMDPKTSREINKGDLVTAILKGAAPSAEDLADMKTTNAALKKTCGKA